MPKILIVDDSVFSQKTTANFIKRNLQDISMEIYYAADGEEGYSKYQEIKPDYTFVDLLMPKIDGKELIVMLKKYDANAKIVVVSADVQKNVKEEIEAYRVMSFVNKPFNDEKAKAICEMIRNDSNG